MPQVFLERSVARSSGQSSTHAPNIFNTAAVVAVRHLRLLLGLSFNSFGGIVGICWVEQ